MNQAFQSCQCCYTVFLDLQNDSGEVMTDTDPALLQEIAEQPTGMQDTDLRSMKDQLLIETSEMLGVRNST